MKRGSHPLQCDTLKCHSDNSALKTTLRQINPNEWLLRLVFDRADYYGVVRGNVNFEFWKEGHLLDYRLEKPVDIKIEGAVFASPASLLIGAVPKGEQTEQEIIVNTQNGQRLVEVLSADSSNTDDIEVQVIRSNAERIVSVVFKVGGEEGPSTGSIFIEAEFNKKIYRIRVPYLAYVFEGKAI